MGGPKQLTMLFWGAPCNNCTIYTETYQNPILITKAPILGESLNSYTLEPSQGSWVSPAKKQEILFVFGSQSQATQDPTGSKYAKSLKFGLKQTTVLKTSGLIKYQYYCGAPYYNYGNI